MGKYRYRRAVSLQYDGFKTVVPKVGAKGERLLADKVVEIAKRYRIPVVEKPSLARALFPIKSGQYIPEELFRAVAIVFDEIKDVLKRI